MFGEYSLTYMRDIYLLVLLWVSVPIQFRMYFPLHCSVKLLIAWCEYLNNIRHGWYQKPGILPTLQESADIEYQLFKTFQIPDTKVLYFSLWKKGQFPFYQFFFILALACLLLLCWFKAPCLVHQTMGILRGGVIRNLPYCCTLLTIHYWAHLKLKES